MKELFFAKNLNYLRKKRNKITQEKLAEKIGVEYSAISNYENNKRKTLPRLPILIEIAEFFCINIDSLLFDDIEALSESKIDLKKLGMKTIPYGDPEYSKYINIKYYAYYYNSNSAYSCQLTSCCFEVQENEKEKRYDVSMILNEKGKKYSGNLVLTNRHIYIYLRGIEHSERAFMTFPKPENRYSKPYIGGIGIISSISAGMRKDPCSQKILIMNTDISSTNEYNEEICTLLNIANNSCIIRVDLDEDVRTFDLIKKINRSL